MTENEKTLLATITRLETENAALRAEKQKLINQLSQAKEDLRYVGETHTIASKTIDSLRESWRLEQAENAALRQQVDALSRALAADTPEYARLRDAVAEYSKYVDAYKAMETNPTDALAWKITQLESLRETLERTQGWIVAPAIKFVNATEQAKANAGAGAGAAGDGETG